MGWLHLLRDEYGERVEDVFTDTHFAQHAQENGYGLFKITRVMSESLEAQASAAVINSLHMINSDGAFPKRTRVKGNVLWYSSLQAVTNGCTCKYAYAGTSTPTQATGVVPPWNRNRHYVSKNGSVHVLEGL